MAHRLDDALYMVVNNVNEAFAADRIIAGYYAKRSNLADEPMERQRVWAYFEQAVYWKLSLAISRLLDAPKNDRASLAGLFREANTAISEGMTIKNLSALDKAKRDVEVFRNLPIATKLRDARNAYMAHALLEPWISVELEPMRDLLYEIANVVDDIHIAVTGNESGISDHLNNWSGYVEQWWEHAFPEKDEFAVD